MPSRVIALFNQAGGVGKTTLTMNLGYYCKYGYIQVPLIDIDSQASLMSFMGIDLNTLDKTVFDFIVSEEPLFILPDIYYGIDIAVLDTVSDANNDKA